MHFLTEENIFLFLVQVFLLLLVSRGLGQFFTLFKQPSLTAEILTGIFFGPTILGRIAPSLHSAIFPDNAAQQNMLETIAWVGVLFLLLDMGLEIDFSSAWRQRGDALKIALSDIFVPMIIAFLPALFVPDRFLADTNQRIIFSMFMAAALTISAMPVTARSLHDLRLSATDLGYLIMSALSVNDIAGWLIFTLILASATKPNIGLMSNMMIMAGTIGFTIICLTAGRYASSGAISRIKKSNLPEPASSLTLICLLGLACGAITSKIGIHSLFGFFIAGIMAGQSTALSQRTRQIISQMVYAIFVPLFFANIGLKIDFFAGFNWLLVAGVTVIGIGGRFFGAWIGVLFTNIGKDNRLSISISHTPGGAMEIVVGLIALEHGVITEPIFVALVCGAIFSSIILGPWLAYSIRRRKQISVLEFFSRKAILASVKGDREAAIEQLAELGAEHENIAKVEQLKEAVLERERARGTAIEEGIALPHARTELVKKPLVVIGRSIGGIDWDSPDGKPVKIIFLIMTPQKDDDWQVQILAHIARMICDADTRAKILEAPDAGAMWNIIHAALRPHVVRKRI
jgi:fructose-specific phosphotransferase system IIA component